MVTAPAELASVEPVIFTSTVSSAPPAPIRPSRREAAGGADRGHSLGGVLVKIIASPSELGGGVGDLAATICARQ